MNIIFLTSFIFCVVGIVKFHEVSVSGGGAERDGDGDGDGDVTDGSLLETYIQSVREALGVDMTTSNR